jgi:zinc protease
MTNVANRVRLALLGSGAVGAALLAAMLLMPGTSRAEPRRIAEITTPSGIKAWLVEEHGIPLVSIKFAFQGGSLQDPAGKEGLAGFLAAALPEGAGDITATEFAKRIAETGADLSFAAGKDAISGGLTALSKRLQPSVELLRLALNAPRFDADTIERVRSQRIGDLEYSASEPRTLALDRWHAAAFPRHAYARPIEGTPATVKAITRDDLLAAHKRLIARQTLKVVIVGDVDRAGAVQLLDRIFGTLPDKGTVVAVQRAEPASVAKPVVVKLEQPLATAAFGLPSLSSSHADFAALQVLNHIIGSGDFDATLMEEIRVKRGLAYAVQVSLVSDSVTAYMLGGMATKNESMSEALTVLKDVLKRTAETGPTREQFENAKSYLTGSFLLDLDTNAKLASSLLKFWLDGKGPDFLLARNQAIGRVTFEDVKRVARAVLRPERLIITVVGQPKLAD